MTYARSLGALVVGHPQDPGLSAGAAGDLAASSPACAACPPCRRMAERMGLERDLALVEMTGVALPRRPDHHRPQPCPRWPRAKAARAGRDGGHLDPPPDAERISTSATTAPSSSSRPPLRSEDDRLAMVEAVADGSDRHHLAPSTPRRTRNPSACPSRKPPPVPWRWKPSCPPRCGFTMPGT